MSAGTLPGYRHRELLDLLTKLRMQAGRRRGGVREIARRSGLAAGTVRQTLNGGSIPSGDTTVEIVKAWVAPLTSST